MQWTQNYQRPARQGTCLPVCLKHRGAGDNGMPASACFGKQLRLGKSGEFTRVFQNGRRATDKFFKVIAVQGNSEYPRLGMVVAKRHIPRAVNRNRVKRIIRESFRSHQDQLRGLDVVVMACEGCAKQPNPELFVSLEKHWRQIITKP